MRKYIALLRHSNTIPILICLTFGFQLITSEITAWVPDPEPDYNIFVMPYVQNCHLFQYPQRDGVILNSDNVTAIHDGKYQPTRDPLKWWLNCLSYQATGTPKFIPIIFNVGIIPLAYLLAVALTRDKLIGLIAVTALLVNPIFTRFENSGTYDQVWSFLLLFSVYLFYKFKKNGDWSFVSLFASLAAKGIGILYLPVWFYTLYKSEKPRLAKVVLGGIVIAGLVVLAILVKTDFALGGHIGFHPENIQLAISQNIKMLWEILPVLIIAIGINRLFNPKNKVPNKNITALWMLSAFMTTPIIYLFSDQLAFVYRFMPFLVFMSIYLGMVIVDAGNYIIERKLRIAN